MKLREGLTKNNYLIMTYQDVYKNQLQAQNDIISALCEARDKYNTKSNNDVVVAHFFQAMIEAVAVLKSNFWAEGLQAELDELKTKDK